jgi:ubiquinone/menaquinone biosynthesis C-methylase UbiE
LMWYRIMKLEALIRSPFVVAYCWVKRIPLSFSCSSCGTIVFDQDSLLSGRCESCRREMALNQGSEYYQFMSGRGRIKTKKLVYPSRTSSDLIYERVTKKIGKGKVLDAGCGQGFILSGLNGQCQVYGLDLGTDNLELAKGSLADGEFCQASIDKIPFSEGVFDYLICTEVLEHLTEEPGQTALRECYRVLKPGGTAVFTVPNGSGPGGKYSSQHIRFFTSSSFQQLLEGEGFRTSSPEKFGLYIPFLGLVIELLLRASGWRLPVNSYFNLTVPEGLATNFLVECRKPAAKPDG